MSGRKLRVERIADKQLREAVFLKRKNGLLRRAMELSVLCDCEVAVMVFAGDGRLATYASSPMEQLLRRYSETCGVPHEAHTTQDLYQHYVVERLAAEAEAAEVRPAKRRRPAFAASAGGEAAPVAQAAGEGSEEGEGKPAAEREASLLFELAQELAPLSPRSGAAFDRICREFDRLIAVHEAEEELEAALKAAAHAADPKEEPAGATGNATDIAAAAHTGGAGAGDSGDAGEGEGDEQQQQQQQQQMPAGTGGLVGGARKLVQVNAAQPQLQLQLQEAGQQQQHTPQSGMALPPAASSATAPSSAAAVVMPQHLLQMQQMIATQGLVGSMVLRPVAVPGSTAVGGAMLLQLQVPTSTAGVQQTVQQQLLQQLLRQQQLVSLAVQQQQQQRQVASGVTSGGTAAATSPALTPRAGQQERQQQQHLPADMRRSEQQQEERREHETVLPIVAPLPALRIRGQQGRQQHEQSPDELVDSLLA